MITENFFVLFLILNDPGSDGPKMGHIGGFRSFQECQSACLEITTQKNSFTTGQCVSSNYKRFFPFDNNNCPIEKGGDVK